MVAWNENIYELDRFEFESGEVLAPMRLSYATTGNQESASEGAVVLLPRPIPFETTRVRSICCSRKGSALRSCARLAALRWER
jgi:hypothetical protein